MHPGFMGWWQRGPRGEHEHGEHGPEAHCGPGCGPGRHGGHHRGEGAHAGPFGHDEDPGAFGVRRPLRFLAHKLELEEAQVAELAAILNELKTERAQAAVDYRRSTAAIAEAVEASTFDAEKAKAAGTTRVASAEKLRDAVTKAVERIHAALDDDQRKKLAYLLRTGILQI